jgi:hypothetical protein
MLEITPDNVVEYLRLRSAVGTGKVLVRALSGGVAGSVLQILDLEAGEKIGTDTRSESQKRRGVADSRPAVGHCFVLKQPLDKFRTAAEWLVDRDRIWVERDCMAFLAGILPAGSVPEVLWSDEENFVLAMSCAPVGFVCWKNDLLQGRINPEAVRLSALILAIMHASTVGNAECLARFGDQRGFLQQRIDPYLETVAKKHPDLRRPLDRLMTMLLEKPVCLIHADYSPKNILVKTDPETKTTDLMLLDFEIAFFGRPVFDVATLINHLLLKGFHRRPAWRAYMIAADQFWHTYRTHVGPDLAEEVNANGGKMLGALMLARMDGKSPVEYIVEAPVQEQIRRCARHLLTLADDSLDTAIDEVALFL